MLEVSDTVVYEYDRRSWQFAILHSYFAFVSASLQYADVKAPLALLTTRLSPRSLCSVGDLVFAPLALLNTHFCLLARAAHYAVWFLLRSLRVCSLRTDETNFAQPKSPFAKNESLFASKSE